MADPSSANSSSSSLESSLESSFVQSSSTEPTGSEVKSLLDVLRSPAPSDLARNRKIRSNPPIGKKRRTSRASTCYEPKSVTPRERVMEFKTEYLTVSRG